MHFGNNIKYLRENKGLTQSELGETLGVNHTTIGGWEKGKSFPYFNTLLALRELFRVDLETLVYKDLEKDGYSDMAEEKSIPYVNRAEEYETEINELKKQITDLRSEVERASLATQKVEAMAIRMELVEKELRLIGAERKKE